MPLTNPNKVVTEERLSEFYGQILPYMGGMPDVLANKFSKGDLYSTDEKMIGCYTDGKPLYQISMQASVSDKTTIPIANISTLNILNWSGVFVQSSSNNTFKLNTTTDAWVYVERSFNGFYFQSTSNWTGEVYITLQYTKTTDSPIAIGSDTDYSTDEKIVGTWIDGKPIYQRTIVKENVSSSASSWTTLVSLSNMTVISVFGYASKSNSIKVPIGSWIPDDNGCCTYWTDSTVYVRPFHHSGGSFTVYATLQYTKTS